MKKQFLILITLSLMFSQTAEMFRDVTHRSARSAALGGTNLASNPSVYSGLSNPAMLSLIGGNHISINTIFNNYIEDRKYPAYSAFDSRNGNEVYAISELFDDQYNFGATYLVDLSGKKMVLGLSHALIYDHNYYYSEIVRKNQASDRTIAGAQELSSEGQVYTTSFGASYAMTDATVGISFNMMSASDVNYIKQVLLEEGTTEDHYDISRITANTGEWNLKSENSPITIRFGALMNLTDQIRVGAAYATGAELEFSNEGVKSTFELPGELGIGVHYYGSNKLAATFMFDYKMISWSEFKIDGADQFYDDVHQFAFGLEHKIGDGNYPLRLGARFENNKHDDTITNTTFTFGSGLMVRDFMIDFSFDYGYRTYSEADLFPENIWIDAANDTPYSVRTEFDTVDQTFMNFKIDIQYQFGM